MNISERELRCKGLQHPTADRLQDVQPQLRPDGPKGGPGRARPPHLRGARQGGGRGEGKPGAGVLHQRGVRSEGRVRDLPSGLRETP